jgi:hypothetical protein
MSADLPLLGLFGIFGLFILCGVVVLAWPEIEDLIR